ncbi:radial spoke head protein 3 homolog B-like [Uloborus diversus]|uniref:radial spoke head protein 3 homolog B-like n=1 Tax=Uloborus diversus TaxID=327109 RepID=UPI00240991C8|nr:radial spoke head protein 3 homolog B-like [Uloborus diversus]
MALDVVQVGGCYVSSSLPKALFVPTPTKYRKSNHRENSSKANLLYFKSEKRKSKHESDILYNECLPPSGKENLCVQTDLYLEELCDVVEEVDVQCETDPLFDRPPSPLFVPAKSGLDASTQIYPGELFDFDEEVEPLLEALVGQTLEQSVIELMAEEELAVISDMQMDYEARRNAELAELKRLEEEDRRILEERQRRLKEQEEAIKLEEEVAQKIAACIFSQNYLSELVPQVYKKLETQGYFDSEDLDLKDIEEGFWPWLMNEVDNEIATLETSCDLLDSLIENAVQSIKETSVIQPVENDSLRQLEENV